MARFGHDLRVLLEKRILHNDETNLHIMQIQKDARVTLGGFLKVKSKPLKDIKTAKRRCMTGETRLSLKSVFHKLKHMNIFSKSMS